MPETCLISNPLTHDQEGFLIGVIAFLVIFLVCYLGYKEEGRAQKRLNRLDRSRF